MALAFGLIPPQGEGDRFPLGLLHHDRANGESPHPAHLPKDPRRFRKTPLGFGSVGAERRRGMAGRSGTERSERRPVGTGSTCCFARTRGSQRQS